MFPIRSGFTDISIDQVFIQSITASAIHEIGKQAIQDTSLLLFHQMGAKVYYLQNNNIPVPVDDSGMFNVDTPMDRVHLRNIVMKFHILDENGLGARLTPLIDSMYNKTPLPADAAADMFINSVLTGHHKFTRDIHNQHMSRVIAEITNFDHLEDIPQCDAIVASYGDPDDLIDVAIYEDDSVQCACDFCEGFFQILEKEDHIDYDSLNPLQKIMVAEYDLHCKPTI